MKNSMNNVNKTLYIPLYGKAYVSKRGLFLQDAKAEEIWQAEQFALKGTSKSKYLAYYMGIRSAVFDAWLRQQMKNAEDAVIIHIGCGMDSRVVRVGECANPWYDGGLSRGHCRAQALLYGGLALSDAGRRRKRSRGVAFADSANQISDCAYGGREHVSDRGRAAIGTCRDRQPL